MVVFAWMSSDDNHLKRYVDLYASLGWDSLICHPQFLNSFFPERAKLLAWDVLNELVKEIRIKPRPDVFVRFSGGPKACLYKFLQIIEGKCDSQSNAVIYTSKHAYLPTTPGEACNELMSYSFILGCCCYTCCIRRKLHKMLNIKSKNGGKFKSVE